MIIVTSLMGASQASKQGLAAERAEREHISGCMSALAADLEVRI